MVRKKQYESTYAGYVYSDPVVSWTSSEEVKEHLTHVNLSKKGGIAKGGIPIISDGKEAHIDASDGHTVIIASSGMKKSICGFMPLIKVLADASENMVVTDPKGELFERTAGYLKALGYNVICADFRTMDKDCYNILRYPAELYREGYTDRALSIMSDLINVLAEEQRKNCKDIFFPDTGALWLNGTGAIMLDAFPEIEQVNVLNWSTFNTRRAAEDIENYLLHVMPLNTARAAIEECCSSAENTFRSILITASSFLAMFKQNPRLAAMLSHSTFTLEDLTKPKTALFLVTDDTTTTADPILGIIINQIQSYLVGKAFKNPDGKLKTRMNFVLDEFASIPFPDADKALATHRSRNIRYYLCVQSLAMLKERYTEPAALLTNCSSTLYLGSTELDLLNELEEKLGNTCITEDGKEKPLCSVSELMMLEKAWDHKEAIYMNLAEGIRYCTMLPSIEAYDIGDYKPPVIFNEPPELATYSAREFVRDVQSKDVRIPFTQTPTRRELARLRRDAIRRRRAAEAENRQLQSELEAKFDELFSTSEDED